MTKVEAMTITDIPIPKSIEANIQLTTPEPEVEKSAAFKKLEEEMVKCIANWQKKMKNIFRQAKQLVPNNTRNKVRREIFVKAADLFNYQAQILLHSNIYTEYKKLFSSKKQLLVATA
mmetsp:Transcript_18469/g.27708  ORF Transcript_18469/g.27708 Transcript_18469/m.27708 type:complete len:118 (+) Transcript_18469:1987-2340(+)